MNERCRTRAVSTTAAPAKPAMRRHSTGMMVGGIVMVSLAPVALVSSGLAAAFKASCKVGSEDQFERPSAYAHAAAVNA